MAGGRGGGGSKLPTKSKDKIDNKSDRDKENENENENENVIASSHNSDNNNNNNNNNENDNKNDKKRRRTSVCDENCGEEGKNRSKKIRAEVECSKVSDNGVNESATSNNKHDGPEKINNISETIIVEKNNTDKDIEREGGNEIDGGDDKNLTEIKKNQKFLSDIDSEGSCSAGKDDNNTTNQAVNNHMKEKENERANVEVEEVEEVEKEVGVEVTRNLRTSRRKIAS
eukprot:Pgem_evm1s10065